MISTFGSVLALLQKVDKPGNGFVFLRVISWIVSVRCQNETIHEITQNNTNKIHRRR